jgi:hypothetical protein
MIYSPEPFPKITEGCPIYVIYAFAEWVDRMTEKRVSYADILRAGRAVAEGMTVEDAIRCHVRRDWSDTREVFTRNAAGYAGARALCEILKAWASEYNRVKNDLYVYGGVISHDCRNRVVTVCSAEVYEIRLDTLHQLAQDGIVEFYSTHDRVARYVRPCYAR